MKKIDLLRAEAAKNAGNATNDANDEWKFTCAHDFLGWLNAIEDAGLVRPVDFNCSNHEYTGWSNSFTQNEEV